MTIVNYEDFPEIRSRHELDRIVLCTGNFDIIHGGHALFFEDCKSQGSTLVTIVAGDEIMRKVRHQVII